MSEFSRVQNFDVCLFDIFTFLIFTRTLRGDNDFDSQLKRQNNFLTMFQELGMVWASWAMIEDGKISTADPYYALQAKNQSNTIMYEMKYLQKIQDPLQ